MKLNRLLMTLCMAVLAVAPSCSTDDGESPSKPNDKVSDNEKTLIGEYFDNILNGRDAELSLDHEISLNGIDAVTDMVWSLWAQANNRLSEDKLPGIGVLTAGNYTPDGTWKLNGEDMRFYFGSKGTGKPATGYPFYLMLHGSGNNDSEFSACHDVALDCNDAPSLYFIPRSPQGGTGCRWYQPSRQEVWERLLRQLYLSGEINPNQVYMFGISEGAYGSQKLASFYADYLAGVGPIAGGDVLYWAPPENCANIAFCLQTGENDTGFGRNLLTQRAQEQWLMLQSQHPGYYNHKIDLQKGYGHSCDYYKTTPYLKKFVRDPYPKYVYWENFPNGNINGEGATFRNGFYNLYVKRRSTDDSNGLVRSCYEMTITGNTIDLKVNIVTVTPGPPMVSGLYISETKEYIPAAYGDIVIYLNNSLVDLSQPVTVNVNGVKKFNGMVKPSVQNLVKSCAEYFDPMRLYPAAVEVSVN